MNFKFKDNPVVATEAGYLVDPTSSSTAKTYPRELSIRRPHQPRAVPQYRDRTRRAAATICSTSWRTRRYIARSRQRPRTRREFRLRLDSRRHHQKLLPSNSDTQPTLTFYQSLNTQREHVQSKHAEDWEAQDPWGPKAARLALPQQRTGSCNLENRAQRISTRRTGTRLSICRMMISMCLSWMDTPCDR